MNKKNPKTLATLCTQYTVRRQTKQYKTHTHTRHRKLKREETRTPPKNRGRYKVLSKCNNILYTEMKTNVDNHVHRIENQCG